MAWKVLRRLDKDEVAHYVRPHAGVYMLFSSEGGPPRYVGRALKLYDRLRAHAQNGEYKLFTSEYSSSPRQCFDRECTLFHRHQATIDNQNHPTADPGTRWHCPVCGL
jgi:hypothetical protein